MDIAPEDTSPLWRNCPMCGERFDERKDPNHREACLDARKP